MSERAYDVQMQISEIEMLQSMFPGEGEVSHDDELTFIDTKNFVENGGKDPIKPLKLDLKLQLSDTKIILNVSFTMGVKYPSEDGINVLVRSQQMNKMQYKKVNEDIIKFVQDLGVGDLQIFQVIEWLNENGPNYISLESDTKSTGSASPAGEPQKFSRLWIYSHHIYSKEKRKNILEWSKELELTGFSMPGKPGVVCVEGSQDNCEEFWQRVKRLNWKHIEVRHRELEGEGKEDRKFSTMSEVSFEVHGNRGNHMSMGSLFQYLNEQDCGKVFVHLFGVEGRLPEK